MNDERLPNYHYHHGHCGHAARVPVDVEKPETEHPIISLLANAPRSGIQGREETGKVWYYPVCGAVPMSSCLRRAGTGQ